MSEERIIVVGLGYVGLPLALKLAEKFDVSGIDKDATRIDQLKGAYDRTGESLRDDLIKTTASWETSLTGVLGTFYIIAVPTPVDDRNDPDFLPLDSATKWVGERLKSGDVVVYESTVYPGATEERCLPILLESSKLQRREFGIGYSPERINPGDKEHTLLTVTKVIAADCPETMERIAYVYSTVCPIFEAKSIRVAEAAKVIENTQRDLNIALINELSIIFERLGMRTEDVLAAARTKWNFLDFKPGLVGGHCIGVDPYYLTYKAREVGLHPEVILSGRRVNDSMASFIARKTIKLLQKNCLTKVDHHVLILGASFKENCSDIRNSKIPDMVRELNEFGVRTSIVDPFIDASQFHKEYGLDVFVDAADGVIYDGIILAVPHRGFKEMVKTRIFSILKDCGVFVDIKSVFDPFDLARYAYWSL